ncbi:lysis protein S [Shigella sonnei]|uniref:Lysis protein S n=2 Tax=Shigella sonnei TaxID=624 RepID=A0A8B4LLQ0_SHISO|nr:lysis protein S [Shigella sonnei]CSG24211.1 lysis protein S [Shigella sonnei]CSG56943.1 lysis protein S [Shigella sonnei]CSG71390.1 lysis protein S [Shigella sonnei]CSG73035.1 lysis protein S [Shigella sonnei]
MEKISTGIAYGTSAGSAGYWFLQWLDQVSPSQWAAIGVLGSLLLGLLTYLTNLYFKIREDKRKWICPYISRHLLSLNPLQARCRRYSRGER